MLSRHSANANTARNPSANKELTQEIQLQTSSGARVNLLSLDRLNLSIHSNRAAYIKIANELSTVTLHI